ncbi:Transcriptional regulatory protein rxt2 [Colletotrichum chlorophyti]|uniref:Transcriptional regulatory protein rxt2 n=1 Tax=Colletotrichum chlorophyti TaxID=708187 RepID=A0A1Q8RLJ9_9PEZI|nr:Transcriptional regulatory protein rxt2 [Colletotrichum chlorophyti]
MASQQILFAETVAAMKKALKRKAYESDSDEEIDHYGNRGQKLKKRALFSHQGQLAPPTGPEVYNEVIDYAGQQRTIISRNPPIIDEEGYEIDSDDDEERIQEAISSATELDPYANIRIEQILAPLTASTDLPTHPTLSKAFTAKTLTEIVDQSCEVMRKENKSLWKVRHLFTRLCGDYTWVPCGTMIGPDDAELYSSDYVERGYLRNTKPLASRDEESLPATLNGNFKSDRTNGGSNGEASGDKESGDGDVSMTDVGSDKAEVSKLAATDGPQPGSAASSQLPKDESGQTDTSQKNAPDEGNPDKKQKQKATDVDMHEGVTAPPSQPRTDLIDGNGVAAQAPSIASDMLDETFVHPFFRPPPNARPDRDVGLPEAEAEDIRRLLALYVQKQEEVCRGARKLHEGLLKANRLRKTVLAWSKAEAHCGPNRDMSDGEDWYDKEEWGLTEDLKKGQDDEEEDTGTVAKKTRNRR